jgi:TonB family protein
LPSIAAIDFPERRRSRQPRRGIPAVAWPKLRWPRCLRMDVYCSRSSFLTRPLFLPDRSHRSGDRTRSPEKRPAAPREATQTPSREPRLLETEANPKPANEAMSGPNPVAKPAAPQPSATHGPEARAKSTGNDIAHKYVAHDHRVAALAGRPRQNGGNEHQRPVQTGFALPFDSGPDSFRAVAVPLPAATSGEAMSYSFIVGGMLERVKHYPETARQRGAKGIAIIGFVLDESDRIASVSLLRSSGDADLDAESVSLVNRAAPFPPPPPGAQDSFAIEASFGMRT